VLVIVGLNIFHPTTNTLLVGLGQAALYAAIMSPVFWVPRLAVTPAVFARLVAALWAWYTLSATVGVLQVYFPGALQPAMSTVVREMGEIAEGMKITLADGTTVWRPMGLTDAPGGAAGAGLFAFLFGMGYFVNSGRWWLRGIGLVGMLLGLVCIYLCQVRSLLIMAGVAAAAFAAVLVASGWGSRAGRLLVAVPGVAVAAFAWALALGGEGVSKRYETLLADNPGAVYYQNRGMFLEHTVEVLLPQYPAGAGLGRWGVMRGFFGDPYDPASTLIYVEIQLTGWLLDGGVPLILAYTAALAVTCWATARVAFGSADGWLAGWAALVLAYDIGAVAVTFNYPLFIGQGGMEFWLLNAAVFTAAARARAVRPAGPR
jgi:hypothetical protein